MDPVGRIKELIPALSLKELREVILLAEFYRERKGLDALRTEDELFYATLAEELAFRLQSNIPPLPLLKKRSPDTYKKFLNAVDVLDSWIERVFKGRTITRIQRRRLYSMAIGLVLDRVEDSPIPLGLKTALNFFGEFPGYFDQAFPGYSMLGDNSLEFFLTVFAKGEDVHPEENI